MAVSAYLEKSLVNEQVTVDIIRNCGLVVNNIRQRPHLVATYEVDRYSCILRSGLASLGALV